MVVIEDILDELYTLDNSQWYDNVSRILTLLSYPVRMEYHCQWEEFLYERSEKFSVVSLVDRKILSKCKVIAAYVMEHKLNRIKLFAIEIIDTTQSSRNNTVYELTKLFRRLYGRFVILVFINGDELAFSGISIDGESGNKVIISDWFGYDNNLEINNRILEVDCSLFSGNSLNEIYNEYLWGIARPYVKYKESKMFLTFGCDNLITYEDMVFIQDEGDAILTTKVDREETLRINSSYYLDIYGDDYFIDDGDDITDIVELLEEKDNVEFEWTMLEMKLALEDEKDELIDDEDGEQEEVYYMEDLNNMNPEEMLKYIRDKK